MANDKTRFWLSLEPLYYPVFERPPFGKKATPFMESRGLFDMRTEVLGLLEIRIEKA